jgi:hypothetical protein
MKATPIKNRLCLFGGITLAMSIISIVITPHAQAQEPNPSYVSFTGLGRNGDNDNPGYTADEIDLNYLEATPRNTFLNVSRTFDSGAHITMQGSAISNGFFSARNQVSMTVTNVRNEGYQATTQTGSHTQVQFLTPGALATTSVYRWRVSGTTGSSIAGANVNGGLSFLAGNFGGAGYNTVFSSVNTQVLIGPGTLTYTLPQVLNQPIDLYFVSGAYFETKKSQSLAVLGGTLSGFSNFGSTYTLEGIDLYDNNDDLITNWTMEDMSLPGVPLFDQDGRTAAAASFGVAAPEPTTLGLFVFGGIGILARRRNAQRA